MNEKALSKTKKISLNVSNMPVEDVMRLCFQDEAIYFTIIEGTIIIKPAIDLPGKRTGAEIKEEAPKPPLEIKGRVTNPNGEPIERVSVSVKGTKIGTTTDKNGDFSINAQENSVLVFSSVGYQLHEEPIKNRSEINISMKLEQSDLDDIVVVGYGTQRKRDVTGSIAKIAASSVRDIPVQGFEQSLTGRAAGVNVTMPNAILGNPPVIRVRGVNSISLSSFPLIVVDGMPTWSGDVGGFAHNNALSDINPADIESFEILKDAAASAISPLFASSAVSPAILLHCPQGISRYPP